VTDNGSTGQESPDSFLMDNFLAKTITNSFARTFLLRRASFSCEWPIRFRTTLPDTHLSTKWHGDGPYRKA